MINGKYTPTFLYSIKLHYVIYLTVWSIYKKILTIKSNIYNNHIIVMSWYFGYCCGILINYINISQMACLVHQYLNDAPVAFLRRHLHFCIFLEINQHPHSIMQIPERLPKYVFITQFWNAIWMCTRYLTTYSWNNHKLVNVAITWKLLSKYIYSIFTYKIIHIFRI